METKNELFELLKKYEKDLESATIREIGEWAIILAREASANERYREGVLQKYAYLLSNSPQKNLKFEYETIKTYPNYIIAKHHDPDAVPKDTSGNIPQGGGRNYPNAYYKYGAVLSPEEFLSLNTIDVVFESGKILSCSGYYLLNRNEILLSLTKKHNTMDYIHCSSTGEKLFETNHYYNGSLEGGALYTEEEIRKEFKFSLNNVSFPIVPDDRIAFKVEKGYCIYDTKERTWLIDPKGNDFRKISP